MHIFNFKSVSMSQVFTEITHLSEKDCFHIVERHKTEFTYPLHKHKEYELNFIERGGGVRRIVGDSVEYIGDYELVLMPVWLLARADGQRVLYTAITRARELLIIVGREETVAVMTENAKKNRRYSGLKLRLQGRAE